MRCGTTVAAMTRTSWQGPRFPPCRHAVFLHVLRKHRRNGRPRAISARDDERLSAISDRCTSLAAPHSRLWHTYPYTYIILCYIIFYSFDLFLAAPRRRKAPVTRRRPPPPPVSATWRAGRRAGAWTRLWRHARSRQPPPLADSGLFGASPITLPSDPLPHCLHARAGLRARAYIEDERTQTRARAGGQTRTRTHAYTRARSPPYLPAPPLTRPSARAPTHPRQSPLQLAAPIASTAGATAAGGSGPTWRSTPPERPPLLRCLHACQTAAATAAGGSGPTWRSRLEPPPIPHPS